MRDIPYSLLKTNPEGYEILLLRDQEGKPFASIAKERNLSVKEVRQIYQWFKMRQIRLYIYKVSTVLGHKDFSKIRKEYAKAQNCYQDHSYACAYLENKYRDILTEYRAGEPGMPAKWTETMPPFKPRLPKETISRIVEMREVKKASFAKIAERFHITQAKAKHVYDSYYRVQSEKIVEAMQKEAKSSEERIAIWNTYFKNNFSEKRRFEMLTKK